MKDLIESIRHLIKDFLKTSSAIEPINDLGDYYKVKRWVKKVGILYAVFSLLALAVIFGVLFNAASLEVPLFFAYTIIPPIILLTGWGYATLIIYFPKMIKSISKAAGAGYRVGENIEETHIQVTHEYGNTYKVSSHTENKGCLFAVISGTLKLMVWAFFCVYIGPFITFKKILRYRKALQGYNGNS